MSSEQEENTDHLNEPSACSSTAGINQSLEKKDNGLNEHAKPRRRRRGLKRKHLKDSASAPTVDGENHNECESELHADQENHVDDTSPTWDSDENLSCEINSLTDVIIRPVNVPKAPENSTQFIMDDHNDCRFYMSFETPNPYLADPPHPDGEEGDIIEPEIDAAYIDIDYQYESPQDFDNSAYYDREFENSYKSNRFDELMRLQSDELIAALHSLEDRLKELSDDLVKVNPSPILEKLQTELLELQERNTFLKESNSKLTAVLCQKETDSSKNNIHSDVTDINTDIGVPNFTCDTNSLNDQQLTEQNKSNECSTTVLNSESDHTKINSNYGVTRCQPNNIVKDGMRTLGINNSDIFHAKCSSSVQLEGGMSPSETSVN